ncbi:MAG: membrane protein insertion efficiency factor YidD [Chlorobi bacterium]|nr:membrane protein insertion efficiency factor YidD [Chlorobiota bacterium]
MIFLLSGIFKATGQTAERTASGRPYLDKTRDIFVVESHRHDWAAPLRHAHNEAEAVFAFLYLVYKTFVSSQDIDSCVFYPSCSTYMMLSIQKHGAFIGFLDGIDRLTRCTPFANGRYPFNPKYKKYEDPVD